MEKNIDSVNSNTNGKRQKKSLKIILIIILIIILLISTIGYFIGISGATKNLILAEPESNLALLVTTLDKLWFDSLIFSFGLSGMFYLIFFIYYLIMYSINKDIIHSINIAKLFLAVLIILLTSFVFVVIMTATKPENTSIIFSLFSYIGSIFLFGYTVFFKDKNK